VRGVEVTRERAEKIVVAVRTDVYILNPMLDICDVEVTLRE
jgi:hypothetical protein